MFCRKTVWKYIAIFKLLCINMNVYAQPYIEGGKTRHRFAQLNLGIDYKVFPGEGSQSSLLDSAGEIQNFQLNNQSESRIIIGGTHFWGHADFYISIPIVSFAKSGFSTGVETGIKYFPWKIEREKVRPYVGISQLPVKFKQGGGTLLIRYKYPLSAGFVYNHANHLIEAGFGYNYNNAIDYYISDLTSVQIKTQPFWVSVGYKFMIETTVSAEKNWQNGKTKWITDTLASLGRLNGLTIAVGPSSAFFLKPSPHTENTAPYTGEHNAAIFPEFGVGYYFHKPDIHCNLSYRGIKSEISAYGFNQQIKRKALTLEAYKFFADYYGFAVFAGLAVSYEWLYVNETDKQGITITEKYKGIKPGITFGWDIRPNRLQGWYLRTNLRYFPNLNVTMPDGKNVSFDQLEFNFIQLVVFPGRVF